MSGEKDLAPETDCGDSQETQEANAPTEGIEVVAAEAPPPSVGQSLRTAREAKGMSVSDVADRLKISPRQVEGLEADDSSHLQCNTIMRGFVRNYARLVGLNPKELMAALDQVAKPPASGLTVPESINVQVPNEGRVERRDFARVLVGAALMLGAVLAYMFLPADFLQSTFASLKERIGSKEQAAATTPATGAEARPAELGAPQPSAPANAVTPPAAPTAQQESVPAGVVEKTEKKEQPAEASSNVLKFSFSKPSWVEVKDKGGQILFSQLSPAGSTREVSGQPPYFVVIGNAGNVGLLYKGKAIDLSKRSKDDVARVTLE